MAKFFYQISDFRPYLKNPKKYMNPKNKPLVARSGLEINYFKKIDENDSIIAWSSEQVVIPYQKPIYEEKKFKLLYEEEHKYFIDLWIKYKNNLEFLVEIKPLSQVLNPKQPKQITNNYKASLMLHSVNQAKWKYANQFCENMRNKGRQIFFVLFTDKNILEFNQMKKLNEGNIYEKL